MHTIHCIIDWRKTDFGNKTFENPSIATQVRSGLMQRPNNVGGVAYKPEFLLDCVLLCDNLREPSLMRDTISRRHEIRFISFIDDFHLNLSEE